MKVQAFILGAAVLLMGQPMFEAAEQTLGGFGFALAGVVYVLALWRVTTAFVDFQDRDEDLKTPVDYLLCPFARLAYGSLVAGFLMAGLGGVAGAAIGIAISAALWPLQVWLFARLFARLTSIPDEVAALYGAPGSSGGNGKLPSTCDEA